MSSLLKKKGATSFKPRAPARRGPAPPSASSAAQSIERQAQFPALPSIQNIPVPSVEAPSAEYEVQSRALSEKSGAPSIAPTRPTGADLAISQPPSIAEEQAELVVVPLREPSIPPTLTTLRKAAQASVIPPAPVVSPTPIPIPTPPPSLPTAAPFEPPYVSALDKRTAHGDCQEESAATLSLQSSAQGIPEIHDEILESRRRQSLVEDVPAIARDVAATIDTFDESVDLSAIGAGEVDLRSQLVPMAPLNPDGTSGAPVSLAPVKARVRATKRKLDDADIDIRPSVEAQARKAKVSRASAGPKKPRKPRVVDPDAAKRRKKRAETPEDAEDQEIDHSTVKMADLCKDLKIGKKFSKHDEIKQRDVDKKAKAKLRREHPELVEDSEDERRPTTRLQTEAPVDISGAGPRMRLVDGQIVIDESSLNFDRHKMAAANAGVMEIVEENEFTRITTSGTFMKREKNIFWDFEAEEKFYNGLRMFGTDFEMISKMFPNRNRRQIKLKFNKEERLYPSKINSALLGERVPIDFDEYKSHTGLEYEDVAVINAEREEIEAEQNAEEARMEAEIAEATRQKKDAIHGRGGAPGKENEGLGGPTKLKKKGKQKKNMASVFGGGEELEIIGDI